jgi:hypothetical protein
MNRQIHNAFKDDNAPAASTKREALVKILECMVEGATGFAIGEDPAVDDEVDGAADKIMAIFEGK